MLGVLIECDPSIKSIIVNIDSDNHDFIIEDLDEERVVVKENMVAALKQKLEDVSFLRHTIHRRDHEPLSHNLFSDADRILFSFYSALRRTFLPSTNLAPNKMPVNDKYLSLPVILVAVHL